MEDGGVRLGPGGQPEQPDDELTIPRAAMNKMIKELLPNIRVANEAREVRQGAGLGLRSDLDSRKTPA